LLPTILIHVPIKSDFLIQILVQCSIGGDALGNQASPLIAHQSWSLRRVFLISKTLGLIRPDLKKDQ
jgi:hypothetical protein